VSDISCTTAAGYPAYGPISGRMVTPMAATLQTVPSVLRVALIDELHSLRDSLEHALSRHRGVKVAGYAETDAADERSLDTRELDAVVINVQENVTAGIETIRALRNRDRAVPIIVIAPYNWPTVCMAMAAGANCCLDSSRDLDRLVSTFVGIAKAMDAQLDS
jgi:DNA-binding NarL/FixJ family response regulator